MNSVDIKKNNDEIYLRDLIYVLWAFKYLIFVMSVIGVILSVYMFLNANKIYNANVIFKLSDAKSSNINLGQEFNAIAALAGLGAKSKPKAPIAKENIQGRVFIESINKEIDLLGDPYFNTYNVNRPNDPVWKVMIKKAIGYESLTVNSDEAVWQNIIFKYKKSVDLEVLKSGNVQISVKHKVAKRAAQIANAIMNKIILDSKKQQIENNEAQLGYLTNIMANSLNDLELTQESLKNFAIKNSALPVESFALGSLTLASLREQLSQTNDLFNAASELEKILQNKTVNQEDYLYLSKKFPIIDQKEFRRILGQSEISSSWSWPERDTVLGVMNTLKDRMKRLQSEIDLSVKETEVWAKELDIYAKLKREEKIAEATYAVLIEQVKAQSISGCYTRDNSTIYEFANPPISFAEPKRSLYLALGLIFGFIFGFSLSIIISLIQAVYYSKQSLVDASNAQFVANAKPLYSLRKKKLGALKDIVVKNARPYLRDLVIEIHKSSAKFIVISSANAKLKSIETARIIASYMQSDRKKIAIINFSNDSYIKSDIIQSDLSGIYNEYEKVDHISILRPNNYQLPIDCLSEKSFSQNLQSLDKLYDVIFICADNDDAISLLRAIQLQDTFHIISTRIKHTKRKTISKILDLSPIQGLFYA